MILNKILVFSMLSLLSTLSINLWADKLTVLTWEEYISESFVKHFEQASGQQVRELIYDNESERDHFLMAHQDGEIDVIVLDTISVNQLGEKGALIPLGEYFGKPQKQKKTAANKDIQDAKLSNVRHIDPFWREQCGNYGVPYLWGTLGLVYRKDKLAFTPDSWSVLFDRSPKLKGHTGFIEDPIDTLAPALFMRGYSPYSSNIKELKQAYSLMDHNIPNILTFEYGITYVSSSVNHDQLHVAMAYSGDQRTLNAKHGSHVWDFVVPREGSILWGDCLAIHSHSKQKEQALDFINRIHNPEQNALNSEYLYVATANLEAVKRQSKEFRNTPMVYPPRVILRRAEPDRLLSPENIRLRSRMVNTLLRLHESQ